MNKAFEPYIDRIEKEIKNILPHSADNKWAERSFGPLFKAVNEKHMAPLIEPSSQLVELGGKRWRPLLLVLTAKALNSSKEVTEKAYSLAPLVELVHTASLIHDDIEDKADTRRGKPSAYLVYGEDTAINTGSWLYFQAVSGIASAGFSESEKVKIYESYFEELRRLHLGQAMDIAWHRKKDFLPEKDEYLAMVMCKTGTLSSLAVRLGALASSASDEKIEILTTSARQLGAGFQIIDDVINITSGNAGKKRGDDIVEGKKSLPVILFAQNAVEKDLKTLEECFKTASKDGIESPSVEKAIALLENAGAISLAKKEGIELIEKGISTMLSVLGENTESSLIKELFLGMIPKEAK